jgi:hypothetical protein
MSLIFNISGLIPSFRQHSALLGVSTILDGGGFKLEDVTDDTWLNISSRLIGATGFFCFFFVLVPSPPPPLVVDITDGDFGGWPI